MKRAPTLLAVAAIVASLAIAAPGDLTRQEPIEINLSLGTAEGEHRFVPDSLKFETGKLYRLRLTNPSPNAYYFHSQGFADSVYSRKIVAVDASGKTLAEVYGPVRRLELKPGSTVEWWFLPVRTGKFDDVMSTRAHTEAGMRATIEIQ